MSADTSIVRLQRRTRGFVVVASAVAGAAAAAGLSRRGSPGVLAYVDVTLAFLVGTAALGVCALRVRRTAAERREPWALLAGAVVCELAARAGSWSPAGSMPDSAVAGVHLAAVALVLVAVLRLRVRTPDRAAARRMLLDATPIAVAVGLVAGTVVFGHAGRPVPPLAVGSTVADVTLAVAALVVLSCARFPGGTSLISLLPVCGAAVGLAAADVGATTTALGEAIGPGALPGFLATGGLALILLGALPGEGGDDAAAMPRRERIAVCAAVGPVVLAALAVVGYEMSEGRLPTAVSVAVVVLGVLLLARLIIALLDNLVLSRTLESQVAERTLEIVTREQWFRSLVQHSSDVVTVVDGLGVVRYQSPSVERLFGYAPTELVGRHLRELAGADEARRVEAVLARVISMPGTSFSLELTLAHRDGSWRETETILTSLLDVPDVQGVVLNTRDVTERKQLQERLTHQAYYDALTGLANRELFQHELAGALTAETGETVAVLFCDLDGFKAVNDSQGHDTGDALLRVVAGRLRRCVRPSDVVARFGGDEFAVLVRDHDAMSAAREVADRIAASLDSPVELDGREVRIGVSIGIAAAGADAASTDVLLRNADLAMYRAKADRHRSVTVFEPAMHDALLARLQVEDDLRAALGKGQLVLHYQPTVVLANGGTVGVEALMRWYHPGRGVVSPRQFIEIAEDNGFIEAMGQWALFEACRQAAVWQPFARPGTAFSVGVNISARQVTPALVDLVAGAVADGGIPPSALLLEMTESVLLERTEEAIEVLRALKRLGVRIAIDDFGTGFSSLSYLSRFPVDVLKIDKDFIDAVDGVGERAELARTIVGLGRSLHVATIAEGIERSAQVTALREMGCEFGQGYLFSRPMPASGVTDLLQLSRPVRRLA